MPRINYEGRNGGKCRYFYGVGMAPKDINFFKVVKVDTEERRVVGNFEWAGV